MSLDVLAIEDNPLNSELVRLLLEAAGHSVEVVPSGAAFRACLTERRVPDIVLMDILLPDADGLQLLVELRAHPAWTHLPVVAVTAQALAGDATRLRRAGFLEVITKPIDTRRFVDQVEGLAAVRK